MNTILINNKKQSIHLTILVFVLFFYSFVVPVVFHKYFYYTNIYKFIVHYNYLIFIISFLFIYILYNGIFYYKIKFDSYSLTIGSRRTLSSFLGSKSYKIEISNDMLIGFRFIRSLFSINHYLLIQMISSSGRKSAIRIPMTLLSKKKKVKLNNILNNIIKNN